MNQRQDGPGEYDRGNGSRLLDNRKEAGARLAQRLLKYREQHALVLGLPRGGVPVAAEIARQLHGDLDVMVARKLGAPGQKELAIGAVAADGTRFVNEELVQMLHVSQAYLEEITRHEQEEARRRERRFRAGLPQLDVNGRVVILVDDGLATGATMRAAVWALRRAEPAKLVVAVPVGAAESCNVIGDEVDELVCLHRPTPFYAVGMYYRDFEQTTDEEVVELLHEHRSPLAHAPLHGHMASRR